MNIRGNVLEGSGPGSGHATDARTILFYDGDCALCDGFVRFVMKRDRARAFWYAPLQGETYRAIQGAAGPTDLSTVVLSDHEGLHLKSDAVLRVLSRLGGLWAFIGQIGRVVPRMARDWAYGFIALRRHWLVGEGAVCSLPRQSDRERMLP